jgi:hypothetical protein
VRAPDPPDLPPEPEEPDLREADLSGALFAGACGVQVAE